VGGQRSQGVPIGHSIDVDDSVSTAIEWRGEPSVFDGHLARRRPS